MIRFEIEARARARIRIRSNFMGAVGRIQKCFKKQLGDCNRGNEIMKELENAFDLFEEISSSTTSLIIFLGFGNPSNLYWKIIIIQCTITK